MECLWLTCRDDDVRRYREQAVYIEDLRSRFRKKLLLIESFEKANRNLEDTIQQASACLLHSHCELTPLSAVLSRAA